MRFEGKVAVVTGAGQGIGEAYAKALAAEGAGVIVAELDAEQGERVAGEIRAAGGAATAVRVDVGDPDSATAMAAAACGAYGGIDFLVNNAAIYHSMRVEGLTKVDLDYYRRFMDVNLHGALFCTRAVLASMRNRGGGVIVNQSSTASWMSGGYYALSKAAINSLTVSLAHELGGSSIRVNAIAPGPIDTAATRSVISTQFQEALVGSLAIKRMGRPDDLVGLMLFLLSDEARWITGQIIAVDGGQIVRT